MIQDNIVVFLDLFKSQDLFFSSTLHPNNLCRKCFGSFEHIITTLHKSSTLQQIIALRFMSMLSKN